jgi:hypothetical protein
MNSEPDSYGCKEDEEFNRSGWYPPLTRRYFSTVIDFLFVAGLIISVYFLFRGAERVASDLRIGLILSIFLVYEPLFTNKLCTLGQWITRIRVRDFDAGGRISLPRSYARFVTKILFG